MKSFTSARGKGIEFEQLFEETIELIVNKNNWLMISNLHLQSRNGFSQIDFIILTPHKYICVETKNWDCEVYCTTEDFWEVCYPSKKFRCLSPVKQNLSHMRNIANYINTNKLEGAVCFCDNTSLIDKVDGVYNLIEFMQFMGELKTKMEIISEEEINRDYMKLMKAGVECLLSEMEKK